jgi:hypothetical protein
MRETTTYTKKGKRRAFVTQREERERHSLQKLIHITHAHTTRVFSCYAAQHTHHQKAHTSAYLLPVHTVIVCTTKVFGKHRKHSGQPFTRQPGIATPIITSYHVTQDNHIMSHTHTHTHTIQRTKAGGKCESEREQAQLHPGESALERQTNTLVGCCNEAVQQSSVSVPLHAKQGTNRPTITFTR